MRRGRISWLTAWSMLAACGGSGSGVGSGSGTSSGESSSASASATGSPTSTTMATTTTGSLTDSSASSTTGSDASTTQGADSTGPAGCPSTSTCLPPIPDTWTGPIAPLIGSGGDEALPCGGAYPTELGLLHGDLAADPHICTCTCGTPTSMSCPTTFLQLSHWGSVLCLGNGETHNVGGTCTSSVSGSSGDHWSTPLPHGTANGCTPDTTTSFPDATWQTHMRMCAPPTPTTCDNGGPCAPTPSLPFDGRFCVFKSGNKECPEDFPDRLLGFTDYEDQRTCTECGCDPGSADCVDYRLYLFNSSDCSGNPVATVPANGTCVQANSSVNSARRSTTIGEPQNGECNPTGGEESGDFVPTGPATICCMSPS